MTRLPTRSPWFRVEPVTDVLTRIDEPHVHELLRANIWQLRGSDRDLVVGFPGAAELIANLKRFVPGLRNTLMLPGCGHWTQQERPQEVNARLLPWLASL